MTVFTAALSAYKIFFGFAPKGAPRAVKMDFDLSASQDYTANLEKVIEQGVLEFIEALFVDNSANGYALTVSIKVSGQKIILPPYSQGYIPVLAPQPPILEITSNSAATATVSIQLLNFPVPAAVWLSQAAQSVSGGSTGKDYSANKPAAAASLLATVPVNSSRASIEVQNQSAEQIQVVLDDGAGNEESFILLLGGAAAGQQGGDWRSTTFKGRVRVYGASAADQVMVHED